MPTPETARDDDKLEGWAAIADFLGVSDKTARTFAKDKGLPIYRYAHAEKSRVWARKAEVRKWQESRIMTPEDIGGSPARVPRETNLPFGIWPWRRWLIAVVAAVASSAVGFAWLVARTKTLSDFRIENRAVSGLDEQGHQFWRHEFPWALEPNAYGPEYRARKYWLGDLDGRGARSLIFGVSPFQNLDLSSSVTCFDSWGNQRWSVNLGREVDDKSGDHFVPPYHLADVLVIPGSKPEDTRIVATANHYAEQPFEVAFMNIRGEVVGEYWHPGHLLHAKVADLDGIGRRDLMLAGVNNGEHRATVVVLDPVKISGIVTPAAVSDDRFQFLHMRPANEKAVILFPRSVISKGMPYTRAISIVASNGRITVVVVEGPSEQTDPGFAYEFDYGLRVISVSATSVAAVDKFRLVARVDEQHVKAALQQELDRLKAAVIVHRRQ